MLVKCGKKASKVSNVVEGKLVYGKTFAVSAVVLLT